MLHTASAKVELQDQQEVIQGIGHRKSHNVLSGRVAIALVHGLRRQLRRFDYEA